MAYIENIPTVVVEDGKEYTLYSTGDEFVGYLHDAEGDRIILAPDGKYYYAENDKDGNFIASNVRVFKPTFNKSRLHRAKIKSKTAHIADAKVEKIKKDFMEPMGGDYQTKKRAKEAKLKNSSPSNTEGDDVNFSSGPLNTPDNAPIHIGQMTNLVVYIRFADDTEEFNSSFPIYDTRFSGPIHSVNNYYQTVSYGKAGIDSYHFPPPNGNAVVSYQDIYNRNYYIPYNATTNPEGYTSSQRSIREWSLLERAINHIAPMVPTDINLDKDNNGRVDSVSFIIKGSHGSWASILWAHRWALAGKTAYIHGKRVWDYCFQPETQSTRKILVHELFHVYGAPDLYRYSGGNITPVSSWDLMGGGGGHMGAWMKHKYTDGDWIADVPEITQSGYYTISSLHNNETNNCYKIKPNIVTEEFYMVEYRMNGSDDYEALFGTGLLIYRINPEANGNANGPPDEVYIYRQNGTLTLNGIISRAHHSQLVDRTAIGGDQPLKGFLKDGTDGGLNISEITDNGDGTITFYVTLPEPPELKTLNLRSIPEGISVTGAGEYVLGQTVTISTTSHTGGNVFQHWAYDQEGYPIFTENRIHEFNITEDISLVAVFEHQTRNLTLSLEPSPELADIHPGLFNTYNYGTIVMVACRGIDPNYQFVHWKRPDNSVYSAQSMTTVNMNQDVELIAVLEPIETPDTFNVDVELILI